MSDFLDQLKKRILVFDGAMGTQIQSFNLTNDDFGGKELEGCNENLVRTRPDVIEQIHLNYLLAGADIVETNSFGSNEVVLSEYDLQADTFELNRLAGQIAKKVAREQSSADKPRFVAGSMGPGTKLPTLGHIDFDTLLKSYTTQAKGLLAGEVDCFIIETCQDLLQVKSAIIACKDAMREVGHEIPIIVQVTVETTGTMLVGSEIAAALNAIEPLGVDVIGLNCATGPDLMREHVKYLCENTNLFVSAQPNAGLPENIGGEAVYPLGPEEFAAAVAEYAENLHLNLVGGCCGTTPEHITALSTAVANIKPVAREMQKRDGISSIYSMQLLDQDPKPFIVGERTNANGSRKFKQLLSDENWDELTALARSEEKEMAHALDVCVAYVGRDETSDIKNLLSRYATQVTIPIVIDSTETNVMEVALKMLGGRSVINSINLEDGEGKLDTVAGLARRYGAALVALTIDETGMAKTIERKVEVAKRIHDLCVDRHGLQSNDLIFDPLTFTLGSGDAEFRDAGINTIEGIRQIKNELPGVRTILGVSNISFGLSPTARHVLNSVFLHYAIEAGLDAAIVNAAKIMPLFKIPEEVRELARSLVFNDQADGDPLIAFMQYFEKGDHDFGKKEKVDDSNLSIEERLKNRIIDGSRDQLESLLDQAREKYGPVDVINQVLLEGMKVVGELFGSGKMQLPFVLQSAEVMKASVALLEPYMEKQADVSKGSIVLATVKGDVHDIGKNLVDIILSNNGYTVYNLGIKQSVEQILEAAEQHQPDAIGMSGLLVKSTVIMKENLEEMNRRQIAMPVLLGGAALTRRYVEEDLRSLYAGALFYGKDAFEGLKIMEELISDADGKLTRNTKNSVKAVQETASQKKLAEQAAKKLFYVESAVKKNILIPQVPFWGVRLEESLPVAPIFEYINKNALFKAQWQFRKGKLSKEEYAKLEEEEILPAWERMTKKVLDEKIFMPKVMYGYFPCQSEKNDLIVFDPESKKEKVRFTFPRQQTDSHLCLADYFRSRDSGEMDVLGLQLVTIGKLASEQAQELFEKNAYLDYLLLHGLSVESAEALAEMWHVRMRQEMGIADQEPEKIEMLFRKSYHGARYSFGYPACPDLSDQKKFFTLCDGSQIGVSLSEEFQLHPEQSTSAIIVHHPEAIYFSV